jgi:hypothetical protein
MFAIQLAKHQEEKRGGLLIAETTKRASPSIQNLSLVKKAAMQEVRREAKASPAKAFEEDNLWVTAMIILPEASLITPAATEKFPRTATSKFPFNQPNAREDQREGETEALQAERCCSKELEIWKAILEKTGATPSWTKMFLALQILSKVMAANNWNLLTSSNGMSREWAGKIIA